MKNSHPPVVLLSLAAICLLCLFLRITRTTPDGGRPSNGEPRTDSPGSGAAGRAPALSSLASPTLIGGSGDSVTRIGERISPYRDPSLLIGNVPRGSDLGADFGSEDHPALRAFSDWVTAELAKPQAERDLNSPHGLALARDRRDALAELIRTDPEAAIRSAIPLSIRGRLGPEILAASEDFVEATGDYRVSEICAGHLPSGDSRTLRNMTAGGDHYTAQVYGTRAGSTSNAQMPFHGIAIDDRLAISESPLRVIEESVVQFGNKTIALASSEDVISLVRRQLQLERAPGKYGDATTTSDDELWRAKSAVSEGTKKWLLIRVDFPDLPGEPFDYWSNRTMTRQWLTDQTNNVIGPHFSEISFGKYDVAITTADVTDVLRMPKNVAYYIQTDDWDALARHAKNAARNAGANLGDYDNYYILSSQHDGDFAGIATLGVNDYAIGNGIYNISVTVHEIGHNLSLQHANRWRPDSPSNPSGTGRSIEYGDVADIMGSDNTLFDIPDSALHTSPFGMNFLDWLPASAIRQIGSTGGTFRLYRYDSGTADLNRALALKIPRGNGQFIWVGYRTDLDGLPGAANDIAKGATITISRLGGRNNPNLIDLGSDPRDDDPADSSLNTGESFTDSKAKTTVAVLARGGSGDDAYLDVQVRVPEVPQVDPVAVPPAGVSSTLSIPLTATENPTRFLVRGLPRGLKFNPRTGEITGKPNVAGTFTIRVFADNGVGRSAPREFQLVVQPLPGGQTGLFESLAGADPSLNSDLGGRLTLNVNPKGGYSAKLLFGQETIPFRGRIDGTPGGDATLVRTVRRRDRSFLDLNLTITTTGVVSGTIDDQGSHSTNLDGNRFTFHGRNNPADAFAGRYHGALDLQGGEVGDPSIPQGTGYLITRVDRKGIGRWTGYTADGLRTTGSGRLLENGGGTADLLLFARIQRSIASLRGRVTIDSSHHSQAGPLAWTRRAHVNPRARNYPAGFSPITITLTGGAYVPPPPGLLLMGMNPGAGNSSIVFSEGGVELTSVFPDLDQVLTIDERHRVFYADGAGPVNPGKVRVGIVVKGGIYRGKFETADPNPFQPVRDLRRTAKFKGIFLPGETEARGFFLLPQPGDPGANPPVSNGKSPLLSGKVILSAN